MRVVWPKDCALKEPFWNSSHLLQIVWTETIFMFKNRVHTRNWLTVKAALRIVTICVSNKTRFEIFQRIWKCHLCGGSGQQQKKTGIYFFGQTFHTDKHNFSKVTLESNESFSVEQIFSEFCCKILCVFLKVTLILRMFTRLSKKRGSFFFSKI